MCLKALSINHVKGVTALQNYRHYMWMDSLSYYIVSGALNTDFPTKHYKNINYVIFVRKC